MQFPRTYTLLEIASLLGCGYRGDANHAITGANEIHVVEPGDIVFVDHPKYYDKALNSAATTILINKEVAVSNGKALLISDDPFRDFNRVTRYFGQTEPVAGNRGDKVRIHPTAFVHPTAVLGHGVEIGENSVIHAHVALYDNTRIGNRVVIHAGCVLGANAFYYKKRPEGFDPLFTCGSVLIEDDVELGAHCTIDRGVTGVTRIGRGSKLDNQVHVGHDTQIGQHCLIAAQTGIAGCVIVEDHVTLWGQAGVRSDVRLGTGSVVFAQSGVSKDLEPGKSYFGSPAGEWRDKMKEMAWVRRQLLNDQPDK